MRKSNVVTVVIAPTGDEYRAWFIGPKGKKPKDPDRYKYWEQQATRLNVLRQIKRTAKSQHLYIGKVVYLKETAEEALKKVRP